MTFTCEVCHSAFHRAPSRRGRFCSPECYTESQRRTVTAACETCRAAFATLPSIKSRGRARFCSLPCFYESRRQSVCLRGHEMTPDNIRAGGGCKRCDLLRVRENYYKNRGADSVTCRCGHTLRKHDGECYHKTNGQFDCDCVRFTAIRRAA